MYYVYEYVRLDTNEPFYIGKGSGRRWNDLSNRSRYFKNMIKNIPVAVTILHDNLTEDEANEIECWYIWQLRDIQGYWLINTTDGGEGVSGFKWSDESKEKQRQNKLGTKRPDISNLKGQKRLSITGENHYLYGKQNQAVRKSILIIDKDNNIIKRFDSLGDLYKPDWRKDWPKPNGCQTLLKCLNEGLDFHGFKIMNEKSYFENI